MAVKVDQEGGMVEERRFICRSIVTRLTNVLQGKGKAPTREF